LDRASIDQVCESADDRRKIERLLYGIGIADASVTLRQGKAPDARCSTQ
jgi:hypothetical protein